MSNRVTVKSFYIRNFLSLDSITVDLKKLNLLVGLNASGKSNIVKAPALLGRIGRTDATTALRSIITRCFGMEPLKQVFRNPDEELAIKIHSEIEGKDLIYGLAFNSNGLVTGEKLAYGYNELLDRAGESKLKYLTDQPKKLVETTIGREYSAMCFPQATHILCSKR